MSKSELGRKLLPYAIEEKEDGYIVLNRDYQPFHLPAEKGNPSGPPEWRVRVQGFTPHVAEKLSCGERWSIHSAYLYDDGCPPWRSREDFEEYMRRLWHLIRLKFG